MTNLFKRIFFLVFTLLVLNKINAQVGIGTLTPDPSAALHVYDTARGMLIPRLTETQRVNIQNPAEGLLVYQTSDPGKGFWYFTTGKWITFATSVGKTVLVLADTITNAEAQLKIATEVGTNTQEIRIQRCSNLTSVDLSMVSTILEVYVSDNPVLQTLNLPNLTSVDGGLYVSNCPQLSNLSIGAVTRIGRTFNGANGLTVSKTKITNLTLPVLKVVSGYIKILNDSSLTSISMPVLSDALSTNGIEVSFNPVLTSLSFPAVKKTGYLGIKSNPNLASFNFSALQTNTGSVDIESGAATNISFPALTTSLVFSITGPSLLSLSLPSLTTTTDDFIIGTVGVGVLATSSLSSVSLPVLTNAKRLFMRTPALTSLNLSMLQSASGLAINDCAVLTTFSVPQLQTLHSLSYLRNCTALTSITYPALQTCDGIEITNCSAATSISFPALTTVPLDDLNISQNANLTSISINNLATYNGSIHFNGNKLPSSEVNAWLHKFVTLPIPTFRTYDFNQTVPAPPTGQGITDKATLVASSNTVNTD